MVMQSVKVKVMKVVKVMMLKSKKEEHGGLSVCRTTPVSCTHCQPLTPPHPLTLPTLHGQPQPPLPSSPSHSFAPWFNPLHDHLLTDIDRASNPFWGIFEDALSSLAPVAPPSSSSSSSSTTTAKTTTAAAATTAKAAATTMSVEREIFPAATDSRFLRKLGIQAVGFSPMASTPTLLHEVVIDRTFKNVACGVG